VVPWGKGRREGKRKREGKGGERVAECPNPELASLCQVNLFVDRTVSGEKWP